MELWIRSQSKLSLIKVNSITIEQQNDNVFFITSGEWRLGTYNTEKRALEVLDEIQNILKPITIFKNAEISKETWEEIQKVGVCAINDRADIIKLDTFVYEMPLD